MRRQEWLIKQIRAALASGLYDDPEVIAMGETPSWVLEAEKDGLVREGGGVFTAWRLTAFGKTLIEQISAPGRPPLSNEAKAAKRAERARRDAATVRAWIARHDHAKELVSELNDVITQVKEQSK